MTYSQEDKDGTRYIFIADVALGKVNDYYKQDSTITAESLGDCHSCHGVKSDPERELSEFKVSNLDLQFQYIINDIWLRNVHQIIY